MDLMTLLPFFLSLAAVGAVAGVIAGLLGVGGGMVLVPAFYYTFAALGHDGPQLMQLCVGTSLATILATSTRSLRAHAARGAVDRDFLRGWAPAIAIGAGAGALLASSLKSDTLTAVFAVLAALAGLWMLLGRKDLRLADHLPHGPRAWGMGGALGLASAVMVPISPSTRLTCPSSLSTHSVPLGPTAGGRVMGPRASSFQTCCPVSASRASRAPSRDPTKTCSPSWETVGVIGRPVTGACQRSWPVWGSRATTDELSCGTYTAPSGPTAGDSRIGCFDS